MSHAFVDFCGWHHMPREIEKVLMGLKYPIFGDASLPIKDSGKGKKILLSDCVIKLLGHFNVRTQAIGDCTSFGSAGAIDSTKASRIVSQGMMEQWIAETSTEDIYGGERVTIGHNQCGTQDGGCGAWVAQYVSQYGTLVRIKYGRYDLTNYSGDRAKLWGSPNHGCPKELMQLESAHKMHTTSNVTTFSQTCDALYNGYGCIVCSQQGFSNVRDKDGFAQPQGTWGHCMSVIGFDDTSPSTAGVCIQNSWGTDWITGPKRYTEPDGSFWVRADVFEQKMLSVGDSWSFSQFDGYPEQKIDLEIV